MMLDYTAKAVGVRYQVDGVWQTARPRSAPAETRSWR